MTPIRSAIACNLDTNILSASLPLFASEKVAAIEWSFDTLFHFSDVPPWFLDLLKAFSNENRLIGHGVFFSLFSGQWKPEQSRWLEDLRLLSQQYTFDHITEHFGYMTGKNFHQGAPLAIPFNKTTLAIGQDRLKRIAQAAQCPVGLENLAFSFSSEEVKKHGDFLQQLLEPVNGFIILDLHNLYCQLHNFDLTFEELIPLYPTNMVREIHISGGSWEETTVAPDKKIRRDTHDEGVPEDVFALLEKAILLCPNLKYVVLEQLGMGLKTEEAQLQFQRDFYKMDQIVTSTAPTPSEQYNFLPPVLSSAKQPVEDDTLAIQQKELSYILEKASDLPTAQLQLSWSTLANSDWEVENWKPEMLETAIAIARKWKKGWNKS